MPSGPDPIVTISFRTPPYCKFAVQPSLGSRRTIHISSVTRFIVSALTKIVVTDCEIVFVVAWSFVTRDRDSYDSQWHLFPHTVEINDDSSWA